MPEKKPKCDQCPSDLLLIEGNYYLCVECNKKFTIEEAEDLIKTELAKEQEKEPFTPMLAVYILGNVLAILSLFLLAVDVPELKILSSRR